MLALVSTAVRAERPDLYIQQRDSNHFADGTRIYHTDSIYQGMTLKLDLGNTALMAGTSRGGIITTEVAMNWRLKNRFYPTFELGYAHTDSVRADGGTHVGQGGFFRVGIDINGMKKHPESQSALLVGIRLGTSITDFQLLGVKLNDTQNSQIDFPRQVHADCWGEVVIGCQVQIYGGLNMGWAARLRVLFTKTDKNGGPLPYYMPGYGYREDTSWGMNYYIGYKF